MTQRSTIPPQSPHLTEPGRGFDESLNMRVIVDAIQSRWKPSPIEDEIACIRAVKLSGKVALIRPWFNVHPLTILEKMRSGCCCQG